MTDAPNARDVAAAREPAAPILRVVVAEDSGLFREWLVAELVRHQIEVTGQARTIGELLDLVAADPPDLVVLDLRMPRADPRAGPEHGAGLDAARRIRRNHPGVAILALSNYDELPWADEIAGFGRSAGYLLKDKVADPGELVEVMRQVAAGELRIDHDLVTRLLARKRVDDPVQRLTPREIEVLQLMAEGLSNAAIARRLWIQDVTVDAHAGEIYRKLGLAPAEQGRDQSPQVNRRVMAVLEFLRSGRA